ncbi:aminotransferase class I and II [Desulfofarcimen acetoxidans DSM 771]|uniref:Aminotransferase n=1 Tax=Desulfofarcimen acetoxidans (strain ATCC 49208 / DSM 771 / KCTC 5769 / VKM B-1644 / 5575) TaxID=485916 RepID=C8W079_DESAS|nr:pyridoxal phosphate-dependent aminotransferase [Desulfofarcimen acetoxidans]ACV63134.1 aminotransferase class I and II [Desulfofarcimen acetoxidans DSM 771]
MRLSYRAARISPSPTLSIDAQAKKMKAEGEKVVNFGVGEPDFDTPEHIKAAAVEAIQAGLTKYTPVAGIEPLKKAIVNKLKVDNKLDFQTNQIVVSSGAKHSLYNTFQVLCQEGDEVILPAPYWVSYMEQIKLTGAVPRIIEAREENGYKITPEEFSRAVNEKTRAVLINSPSNPTGAVYTRAELEALGEIIVKHNITVISDEIYEKLIYDNLEHISIASLSSELKELTIIINGVSKAYAMTGWRIGYAAAPVQIAKAMSDLQSHATSNASSIAQAASVAAIQGNQQPLETMRVEFAKRRDYMLQRLQAIPGVKCEKPGGAFYLFPDISGYFGKSYKSRIINSSTDLAELLLQEVKVALVPGIAFGCDKNFRLSYATSMENIKEGLDRIADFLVKIN